MIVIKVLPNLRNKYHELQVTMAEIRHLLTLDHPNIDPVKEVFTNDDGDVCFTTSASKEFDLREEITKRESLKKNFTIEEIKCYLTQIVSALVYAHTHNVAHTDLRPVNIHLQKNEEIHLANMGLCLFEEFSGPPEYRAPEGVHLKFHSPVKAWQQEDCWSLGILVYELFVLKRPNPESLEFPKDCPKWIKTICENLIVHNPRQRWTMT